MRSYVSTIDYPEIKPLRTYSDKKVRHTSITGFQTVLSSYTEKEESGFRIVKKSSFTNKKVTNEQLKKENSSVSNNSSVTKKNVTTASSMKKTAYDEYFEQAAEKYGVSVSLLKGIAKAESNFNPNDRSSAGAAGIMQLMPATAKELGVTDVYDPKQNIFGGAKCISQKIKEFNGDIRLALAAYNAGSGAVRRCGGVPSACRTYVNRVLSYKEAFETAKKA